MNPYNLFVAESCLFHVKGTVGKLYMNKRYALSCDIGMDMELLREYGDVTNPVVLAKLRKLPSLFVRRNASYKYAEPRTLAYIGHVTGIKVCGEYLEVSFSVSRTCPQRLLNERPADFGIRSASATNELDKLCWLIKAFDLYGACGKHGIG